MPMILPSPGVPFKEYLTYPLTLPILSPLPAPEGQR